MEQDKAMCVEEPDVNTLTVKLPTFWADKPEAWFAQADSHFAARRITNQVTKFHLTVIALDAETVNGVLDLIEGPPDSRAYEQLKERLVQSFRVSTLDKIKKVLDCPPVADEIPGRLADKIMAWIRNIGSEDFAKAVFMLKLPEGVRKVMWAEPVASWETTKARANALWHAERARSGAALYTTEAAEEAEADTNAVAAKASGSRRSGSRFQEFARSFEVRPNGPCVFHAFFGATATKCREPCSRAGNAKAGWQ